MLKNKREPVYCSTVAGGIDYYKEESTKVYKIYLLERQLGNLKMIKARYIAQKIYHNLRRFAPRIFDSLCAIWKYTEGTHLTSVDSTPLIEYAQKHKNHIQNIADYERIFSVKQPSQVDSKCLNIAFIVPKPIKGSGGHRNIYRAVKYLREFGHDITVYYTQTCEPASKVKQQVSEWFYDMTDIPFICYDGHLGYHQVAIATWWETVYLLKENIDKVQHPFYFTQDFESYFYPMSSEFILCENTYRAGFTCICSGPWIAKLVQERFGAKADYFQFPIDTTIYNRCVPRVKNTKNVVFFAKPDMPRRCYSLGIQTLKLFHALKPNVEIILYGSSMLGATQIPFPVTIKKLVPSLEGLADLYRNADLGIVFSTTNPSLVPYEMMACGCPVVDLDLEYAIEKYGNNPDNVFLLSPQPDIMAKQLANLFDHPEMLCACSKQAAKWVKEEFPTEYEMARRVEELILRDVFSGEQP